MSGTLSFSPVINLTPRLGLQGGSVSSVSTCRPFNAVPWNPSIGFVHNNNDDSDRVAAGGSCPALPLRLQFVSSSGVEVSGVRLYYCVYYLLGFGMINGARVVGTCIQ